MNQGVLGKVEVGTYTKSDGTVVREHERKRPYSNITGEGLTKQQIKKYAKLIGLPESIKGDLKVANDKHILFKGEGILMKRKLGYTDAVNEIFNIEPDSPWKGQGSFFFERQVDALKKAGFKTIETLADKGEQTNGYYTWARLGYIPKNAAGREIANGVFKDAGLSPKSFEIAFTDPAYRKAWKEKGEAFSAEFDLSDNSYSMNTLKDYNSFKRKTVKEIL